MSKSMYMNVENMKLLAESLNKKIESLSEVYLNIVMKTKVLNGSSDVWRGDNQKRFFDSFSTTLVKYPKNIEKLKEFRQFLLDTIDEYENKDNTLSTTIDNNEEMFDV